MGTNSEIVMKLKGKTQKGKNRIRECGDVWFLERTADSVLFDPRPGPWGLVTPESNKEKSRWIHMIHDTDFEIVS